MSSMRLYNVDVEYVKKLHDIDSEVFYSNNYNTKPYVGIVIIQDRYNYFIPLTSAKPKHSGWHTKTNSNYLIYEKVKNSEANDNWIKKLIPNSEYFLHILSVLEIKKMIPVPKGLFKEIDINNLDDEDYKSLLHKERRFLLPIYEEILKKANNIYEKQIKTGKVLKLYCDFKSLEKICDTYLS